MGQAPRCGKGPLGEIGQGVGVSNLACLRLLALLHPLDMEQVAAFLEYPYPALLSGSQTWPWFMDDVPPLASLAATSDLLVPECPVPG